MILAIALLYCQLAAAAVVDLEKIVKMAGDPADMSRRLTEAIGRVIAETLNAREAGFYVNSIMNNANLICSVFA